ncbi:hypothetical protein GX50_06403 [[Emmonsia] crescens]|uniref:Uncharacterized protein n=1 Tax=[Emmonsia] crescens TaxID=73230 RepID=A0A2B7ZDA9_9EURO|nr:hypothetical protein GX50_06403 [Emmonsia crescens]
MPDLHIPGIPTRPNNQAARKRNGPAFKTFPQHVTYKEFSTLSKPQPLSSSRSSRSTSTTSSHSGPFVIPRTRPRAGDAPVPSGRYSTLSKPQPLRTSTRSHPPARPSAPIPSSRFSTHSIPQPLRNSTRSPPPARPSCPIPSSRFSSLSRPQPLSTSSRSPPPARPSAPVPSSTYSTLSKPRHLHVSTRSFRSTSTTSTLSPIIIRRPHTRISPPSACSSSISTRSGPPPRPSSPIPSSRYSTLSKPQHIHVSTSSSPAPSARPVPSVTARSSFDISTCADSFPSTRCFISAALKAAAIRSSPAPPAPPVSSSVSTHSPSTRSGSLISTLPIPLVRFNRVGDRLEAALEVVRRHRREHAQLCSDSSSASITVSSSHGSKDGSSQARTYVRRNFKSAKSVKFGGAMVHEVGRWIKPGVHTQRDPPTAIGKLTGWSVTPLEEPEDDEDCKYTTYWGGQVSQLTHTHLPGKPCGRSFCSWNDLANVRSDLCKVARLKPNNPSTSIRPGFVFEEFNRIREKMRGRGHFLL